jgi:two-component system KDP operon response regulator KdpE
LTQGAKFTSNIPLKNIKPMKNILVIDDEPQMRKLLELTLRSGGYNVIPTATASKGIFAAANHKPDLIILDLGLPDESGHVTLKKLREWYRNPVLILSVRNDEKDIIESLDNGANDYMVKPFRTGELLARIRSALKNIPAQENDPVIKFPGFEIDLSARSVKINNQPLKLTATQYHLLALFAKNEGRVLTHDYILKKVWGPDYTGELQYLRVYVGQLRNKIEKDPNRPPLIVTEPTIGYRFVSGE